MKIRNPAVEGGDVEPFGEYEPEEGEMGRREIEVQGRKFICVASLPFGFFTIKIAQGGPVPSELKGNWMTVHDCKRAIASYMGKLNE